MKSPVGIRLSVLGKEKQDLLRKSEYKPLCVCLGRGQRWHYLGVAGQLRFVLLNPFFYADIFFIQEDSVKVSVLILLT